MTATGKAAVWYAEQKGWPVIPVHGIRDGKCTCGNVECEHPGKHPRTPHGVRDATCDIEQITRWWSQWPDANVAIATGAASRVDVLDVDPRHYGDETLLQLERQHGEIPATIISLSGGGGSHIFFEHVAGVKNSSGGIGPGLDYKTDGGYVVAAPSVHVSGRIYTWEGASRPDEVEPAPLPEWLLARLRPSTNGNGNGHHHTAASVESQIPAGQRNMRLTSLAGTLRRRGLGTDEIYAALEAINQRRCDPPLSAAEVRAIAESVSRYEAADPISRPPTPSRLESVLNTFGRWLYLPDPGIVEVTLAAIVANRIEGDPVYLMLIGAPGSGKTETLQSVVGLPHVHSAGTLTEASLLSGTPTREKAKDAVGGLLRKIGDFGYLVCKDFTSVLQMNRETRAATLSALREIYDGSWTRHVGTDGGRTLHWAGKVAMICGCTPAIDSHHAVMASMGERFLLYRVGRPDEQRQAQSALSHIGRENAMRRELAGVVADLFAQPLDMPDIGDLLSGESRGKLIALASLVARCRSAVERDGYTRDITLIPDAEAPTRLVLALAKLFGGLIAIGASDAESWRVIHKVGMDCLPAIRKAVFDVLQRYQGSAIDTTDVATKLDYPTSTARRALEDLTAHGIARRISTGKGKADLWQMTDWAIEQYATAGVPEKSGADE